MRNFIVIVLIIGILQCNHKSRGYYELVEELGCHDTEFRLTCGRIDARIAIIEATFSHNDSAFSPVNASCGNEPNLKEHWRIYKKNDTDNIFNKFNTGPFEVNFRHAINKRCSGVNYCSFILKEDYAPAVKWGSGSVYLRYMCMDDYHIVKSCTAHLDVDYEGFVQSPGYPRFYVGERICHWTLQARPPQTVKINFLDISLRGVTTFSAGCLDRLIVSENGFNMLVICGDSIGDTEVQSSGSVLNVSLIATSKLMYPKRGLLFHYKAVGCLTPKTPQNANLVFRNDTQIHFQCCPGFVFPDTLTKDRILHCYQGNAWDNDILDCTSAAVNVLNSAVHLGSHYYGKVNFTVERAAMMDEENDMKDIVIPSIIIAVILIGNAFILILILHYRKKLDLSQNHGNCLATDEQELKTLPGANRKNQEPSIKY